MPVITIIFDAISAVIPKNPKVKKEVTFTEKIRVGYTSVIINAVECQLSIG
jgi:hypothetical protein